MLRIFTVIGLVLLGACATTRKYQEKLEGWVGRPSTELLAQWGTPTSMTTNPDGTQNFVYTTIDEETFQKTARSVAGYTPSCRTTFQIRQGHISGWKWNGENCRSK